MTCDLLVKGASCANCINGIYESGSTGDRWTPPETGSWGCRRDDLAIPMKHKGEIIQVHPLDLADLLVSRYNRMMEPSKHGKNTLQIEDAAPRLCGQYDSRMTH